MSRGPDAATLLERALLADAVRSAVTMSITDAQSTRWASATFLGARHRLHLMMEGDARSWLHGLPEAELPMRRHLVADLAVVQVEHTDGRTCAVLEALTVEDA